MCGLIRAASTSSAHLEHVYMDTGSWSKALTVCMDIVGETLPDGLPSVSTQKDECALHTMEDIDKIYNYLGDNDKSISWLTLAATTARSLFGVSVETIHIFDKLENLLVEQGRYREAELLGAAGVY
ncbi:putative Clr5 domain-containing protein [Seiridium unicorne]|uniref:Clr5 domain-containing protein n=1 Tax=Seiridium unicorne TaxID=138068 RepID=A0ABR2UXI1_9PEZI